MIYNKFWLLLLPLFLMVSCRSKPGRDAGSLNVVPTITPDYTNITIPFNIAPLNFSISTPGEGFYVVIIGSKGSPIAQHAPGGKVMIPVRKWKKLLSLNRNGSIAYRIYIKQNGKWSAYQEFNQVVSDAGIDKFLYYRLLYPGYESWSDISIVQRSLEDFTEKQVVQNNVMDQNCVNCHSFNPADAKGFMLHVRGSHGGTLLFRNGTLRKFNLKAGKMENGAVYARWHPSGKYIAFSSNKVIQQFHALDEKRIEVSDLNSSLVLYDLEKNEMSDIPAGEKVKFMDTYPEWSPDGKMLYFCRAESLGENWDYRKVRYSLCRIPFDPVRKSFGQAELLLDAAQSGKSISFPRISPDGQSLVYTSHDYGCFPIWHKEADLWIVDLTTGETRKLELNSEQTDSYHSWSGNGMWLVFSSKRGDGLTARPYIACINAQGQAMKPFILPQKDPALYDQLIKSFNLPEFSNADVTFLPGELKKVAGSGAIPVKWAGTP